MLGSMTPAVVAESCSGPGQLLDCRLWLDLYEKFSTETVSSFKKYCEALKKPSRRKDFVEPTFKEPKRLSSMVEFNKTSTSVVFKETEDVCPLGDDLATPVSSRSRPSRRAAVKARNNYMKAFANSNKKLRRPTNFDSKLGMTILSPIPQTPEGSKSDGGSTFQSSTFVVPSCTAATRNETDVFKVPLPPTVPKVDKTEPALSESQLQRDNPVESPPRKKVRSHKLTEEPLQRTEEEITRTRSLRSNNPQVDDSAAHEPMDDSAAHEPMDAADTKSHTLELPVVIVTNESESKSRSRTKTIRKKLTSGVEPMETQSSSSGAPDESQSGKSLRSRTKTIRKKLTNDVEPTGSNDAPSALCVEDQEKTSRSRTKTLRKHKVGETEMANTFTLAPDALNVAHSEGEINLTKNDTFRTAESRLSNEASVLHSKPLAPSDDPMDDLPDPQCELYPDAPDSPTLRVDAQKAPRTRSKAKMAKKSKTLEGSRLNKENPSLMSIVPLLNLVSSSKKKAQSPLTPSNALGSAVKPKVPRPVTAEKVKLEESKKKEEVALKKKNELMLQKKEEIRKNREMKAKKVAESRAAAAKEKLLQAEREKEKEERERQIKAEILKQREESQMRKKQLNLQKAMEAEERRQKEEAMRRARLKEIEEEQRKINEQRQKELEEAERLAALRKAQEKEEEEAAKLLKAKEKEKAKQPPKGCTVPADMSGIDIFYGLDEEEAAKIPVPSWAEKPFLTSALDLQASIDPSLIHSYFGPINQTPDLHAIFGSDVMLRPRTSSAVWATPPATHRVGTRNSSVVYLS